ncbi:PhzF family phenazine biosynthesis protein [Octadecabacter sp. G9-8]|uniref:PhzF family phenazine biosynthesis protein n=1 Tax=Octadecabacter dasysiphoniae TaxID=2909341 RepID=A0ABS9CST5_9RHOB|nr:PhzF family phenazine biosynthesis protein [Octadecabacter dasysiphoniae]MCF2870304.1 PhzF family phenazine biosynthesis protein [Octadecabacter dasysiphoniae]
MPHDAPKTRAFMQCDVFSTTPMGGNGLAVVMDGAGLDDDTMQTFARWTNLAETTFICPPTDPAADYDIRIFTTARELPFAGHPTLGTATCWLAAGNTPKSAGKIVQNCGVGLVEIDLTGDTPAFVAPPTQITDMPQADVTAIAQALNLDPNRITHHAVLNNGPVWHAIEMADADDLLTLDAGAITPIKGIAVGLIAPHSSGDVDYEVRMFSMWGDLKEDPITGSLNAALAHWMQAQGRVTQPHIVAQGTCISRHGRVHVIPNDAGEIRIGGHTNILIEGRVTL